MQNLEPAKANSLIFNFNRSLASFSSTKLKLRQRYIDSIFKVQNETTDKKKAELVSSSTSQKDVLFEEIKGMLKDF